MLDKVLIARKVSVLEIGEELAPFTYHDEKSAAAVEILLVDAHMLRQFTDTRSEDGDLYFSRACIGPVHLKFFNYCLFFLLVDHSDHSVLGLFRPIFP